MEKHSKPRINRSKTDNLPPLTTRPGTGGLGRSNSDVRPSQSRPGLLKAVRSATNLAPSKVSSNRPRSKFTVSSTGKKEKFSTFTNGKLSVEKSSPASSPIRKFPIEKSLTMFEIGSPSKKSAQQNDPEANVDNERKQHSCSTNVLTKVGIGGGTVTGIDSNHTSKLVYETGFKMLIKCWREKKREIGRLNAQLSVKDSNTLKYKNQLETIQSLYRYELNKHESSNSELRALKLKLETLKANLLAEKTAHLKTVSDLEVCSIERDKLQAQLEHTEKELAAAILNWHSFEYKLELREERCTQLEKEKQELLKQIDTLEENFRNFEKDFEKTIAVQTNSTKLLDSRLENYQKELTEANSKLEVYETDCQLLKEWNVRLAGELAQIKSTYQSSYSYRMRKFFYELPRKPAFYLQYALYLMVRGTPAPHWPQADRVLLPYSSVV
ncbi:uncharacterized protein LOC129745514 [Uranotaenia lowii]|uniref:uncharacterized protein LOC129745514 n=1 Tax=Uranotaenia lowii TaxID=190385 RepID=UPI002479863D|nr:uncharacterized protein LOC129745514 [Uranotaenia lowii]